MKTNSPVLQVTIEQSLPMPLKGSFHCESGQLLALVGPSGAGKTSLMRILSGLMHPQQGKVIVDEEIWCDTDNNICLPPQRRHVGMVFQNYALMPHFDAIQNVSLPLLHLPKSERLKQAKRWLDHVGLTNAEQHRKPADLSGGQQQRVAVARALAREPKLMLLDEPFSAVDQMNRQSLYKLLADLRHELAIPIILVTHDLNEARMLADQLVVIDNGQILQQGTPSDIYNAPRNARVADLVGIHNRFVGEWIGPAEQTGQGLLRWRSEALQVTQQPILQVRDKGRLPEGQPVNWVIPSDGIALIKQHEIAQENDFNAEVTESRHLGEINLLTLTVEEVPGAEFVLTLSGSFRNSLSVGTKLGIRLDLNLVHVMPIREDGKGKLNRNSATQLKTSA
ncbi:ABC transporter ATP-binding protein [Methylophaga sp.]|uniref:ABC transporter ATP-binding protein n=1 Tax=Methylophaga sp. TaxID=2024840 RepID=UPI003A91760F